MQGFGDWNGPVHVQNKLERSTSSVHRWKGFLRRMSGKEANHTFLELEKGALDSCCPMDLQKRPCCGPKGPSATAFFRLSDEHRVLI